jgi:hypothetical protein
MIQTRRPHKARPREATVRAKTARAKTGGGEAATARSVPAQESLPIHEGKDHPWEQVPRLVPVLQVLGMVVAPTTLLSALLLFFGWVYVDTWAEHFGLRASVLNYSVQDYLLRSIQPVIHPLGALLLMGLVFLWIHSTISGWVNSGRHRRLLASAIWTMLLAGLGLFSVGIAGIVGGSVPPLFGIFDWLEARPPLARSILTLGIISSAYGIHLLRGGRPSVDSKVRWVRPASATVFSVLLAVSLFWLIDDWAQKLGRIQAFETADGMPFRMPFRPDVILFSKQDLNLDFESGVTMTRGTDVSSAYPYRYGGLKFLGRSGGKYFLVPSGWSHPEGRVIVLHDTALSGWSSCPGQVDPPHTRVASCSAIRPRTPLTNRLESSVEYRFASSTASLIVTAGGMSGR